MKQLLLPLFLFFAACVQGQKGDTIIKTLTISESDAFYWKIQGDYKWTQLPKSDTIKVIIQVCDTTDYGFYTLNGVWWERGYRVTKTEYVNGVQKTVTYLDERKKPLGKNILVWQWKEL